MKIYIASSWRNQHAVEMLTALLRNGGHEVKSFVEKEDSAGHLAKMSLSEWIDSPGGAECFEYDTSGATDSELVIYVGPSGCDAWAEVGAAWASSVPIVGLWAKAEQAGLMRRMISYWFSDYRELLKWLGEWAPAVKAAKEYPLSQVECRP